MPFEPRDLDRTLPPIGGLLVDCSGAAGNRDFNNHMGTLLEAFGSQSTISLICQLLRTMWHVSCVSSSAGGKP